MMSVIPDSLPAEPHGKWLQHGALTIGVMLLLAVMFWPTLHSMIEVWDRSETFTHGYLILPISIWLIWRRREWFATIRPEPDSRGLAALALAGAGWLLADAGSVNVAAQYAFIAMLIASVWTLLGWRFGWAAFFPLMFLFFAVPVGEFLIYPLMGVTADFTVAMLQLTGIPVFREGMYFSIPSGDWSVVEACSGLRYLIASITLGTLYAYLTYRSWKRRLVFAALSMAVPILANGIRAYLIVMIGHVFGTEHAVGVDHLIYGWVFFGFVMLLLFWAGSFWREDEEDIDPSSGAVSLSAGHRKEAPVSWIVVLGALLIAGIWPAYAAYLNQLDLPEVAEIEFKAEENWLPSQTPVDWTPHWVGAHEKYTGTFTKEGSKVLLVLNYYVTQRQGAELINSQNYMVSQSKYEGWVNVGETSETVDIGGQSRLVRQALLKTRDSQPRRLLVWQWNVINGKQINNDYYAKLLLALEGIRMARDDGTSVIIAAPYEVNPGEAAGVMADFIKANEKRIDQAIGRVSRK